MLSFALGQILIVIAVHKFICYRAQLNLQCAAQLNPRYLILKSYWYKNESTR